MNRRNARGMTIKLENRQQLSVYKQYRRCAVQTKLEFIQAGVGLRRWRKREGKIERQGGELDSLSNRQKYGFRTKREKEYNLENFIF